MTDDTLIQVLKGFQRELTLLQEKNERALARLFKPVAEELLLRGCFAVRSKGKTLRRIYPYTVEFYYHEEDGPLKDRIVYHRNPESPSGEKVPSFAIGTLHTHDSGIDVTFEAPDGAYRASALIRAFQVKEGDDEAFTALKNPVRKSAPTVEPRSTYLYDYLFMGVPVEDGIEVAWIPDDTPGTLFQGYRVNVHSYRLDETEGKWLKDKDVLDRKPWAFSRGPFSGNWAISDPNQKVV